MKPDMDKLKALDKAGKFANQDEWFVVGLPWNNRNPYINTKSNDPHLGRAIIDVIEPDCIEGEDDEEITKKEIELEAEMNANMRFVAQAANCRQDIAALIEQNERYREALEFISQNVVFEDADATSIDYHETLELHQRKAQQALKESE